MGQHKYSIADIAAAIGAQTFGDTQLAVTGVAEPQEAGPDDLAMATSQSYADLLPDGQARAAVLWEGADWQAMGLQAAIVPKRPRYAMAGLTKLMDQGQGFEAGIHPTALVDPQAEIGENVSIGALSVISAGAKPALGISMIPPAPMLTASPAKPAPKVTPV